MKALLVTLLFFTSLCYGYETDQYSSLGIEIKDSKQELNQLVNRAIKFTASNWVGKKNSYKFAMDVAKFFGNRQLERYTNIAPSMEQFNPREESIYRYVSAAVSPIIRYKLLASTINIDGVHLGADKMSHFFGVGPILFTKYTEKLAKGGIEYGELDAKALQKALDHSVFTEYAYWGMATTGVYSNADLVVNYEGFRFLLGMFVDDITPGNKAIIKWDGNKPVVVGEFDFSDYINDYWSEALNPNRLKYGLRGKVKMALQSKCFDGSLTGATLRSPNDEELNERYAELLGLTSNRYTLLMDDLCTEVSMWNRSQKDNFVADVLSLEDDFSSIEKGAPTDEPELGELIASTTWLCRGNKSKAKNEHQLMVERDRRISEKRFEFLESAVKVFKANKQCSTEVIRFRKSSVPTRGNEVRLSINYCVERVNGELKRDKYYSYANGGRVLYSMEGYIDFDDTKSYIIRTTNKNCNWY